mgnify:CR=1 FL=1
MDSQVCYASDEQKTCKIRYSTRTLLSSSTSNVVNTYSTQSTHSEEEQLAAFENIKACALQAIDTEIAEILSSNGNGILDSLDYSLDTFEGDSLHQQVDCIFMGAYNSTFMLPADRNGVLEPLMYSRHENGSTREFDIPCEQKILRDSVGGNHSSNTCGTRTRQSAMMYVKALFNQDSGVNEKIKRAILNEMTRVRSEFDDTSRYKCTHKCCTDFDESCIASSEVNFDPDVNANLNVDISQFMSANNDLRNIQYTALTDVKVRPTLRRSHAHGLAFARGVQRLGVSAHLKW